MEARPVAPPPAYVAKADPEPTAVEFLMTELPLHVRAFLAEITLQDTAPTAT